LDNARLLFDDWIAEHITAVDACVTSDIPLASRCLKIGARVVSPTGTWNDCLCRVLP